MTGLAEATRRVLLVEDNPGDAGLIQDLLEGLPGHPDRVERVDNLRRAAEHLRSSPVDAVLLDLGLPDGFGVDFVTAIRKDAAEVPIVVLTGMDDELLALRCIAAGAQDYLPKQGLHPVGLRRAIGHAVARVQALAERVRADALQARLAAIVDSSSDAIVGSTVQGVVTSWNRGAERIFGYAPAEAVGRPVREVIRPLEESVIAWDERRVFQPRVCADASGAEDVVRMHKDGRPLTLSVVTSIVRDASGVVQGLAAILRDMTDSRRRDAELQRLVAAQAVREQRMTALTARLRNLQEDERTRISREVHDGLGQLLTGLKLDLRWLTRRIAAGVDAALLLSRLAEAEALVDQTVATVQRIALELRPSALDVLGLPAAVRDEARRFEARSGVRTQVDIEAVSVPDRVLATALFRILQELLTNVARHAAASSVQVELREQRLAWHLRVSDDGVGIPEDIACRQASLGLLGMTERAASVGGSFVLERGQAGGTVGRVSVPKTAAQGADAAVPSWA